MTELTLFGNFLTNVPVYFANGVLEMIYWLISNAPAIVCIVCAVLMIWLPDIEVQQRAGFRPRRGERGRQEAAPRTAQAITVIVLVAWLAAQWGMSAPVRWIGAAMWACGLLAVFCLAAQRFNLLWYVKAGIAMYALAVIGSRIYLVYTSQLSPDQWAALIGSSQSAATIIANTRGSVTTIILWALWLVVPLGYFSMLVQQVFINPMSLVSPFAGAQDMLRSLRVRGGR